MDCYYWEIIMIFTCDNQFRLFFSVIIESVKSSSFIETKEEQVNTSPTEQSSISETDGPVIRSMDTPKQQSGPTIQVIIPSADGTEFRFRCEETTLFTAFPVLKDLMKGKIAENGEKTLKLYKDDGAAGEEEISYYQPRAVIYAIQSVCVASGPAGSFTSLLKLDDAESLLEDLIDLAISYNSASLLKECQIYFEMLLQRDFESFMSYSPSAFVYDELMTLEKWSEILQEKMETHSVHEKREIFIFLIDQLHSLGKKDLHDYLKTAEILNRFLSQFFLLTHADEEFKHRFLIALISHPVLKLPQQEIEEGILAVPSQKNSASEEIYALLFQLYLHPGKKDIAANLLRECLLTFSPVCNREKELYLLAYNYRLQDALHRRDFVQAELLCDQFLSSDQDSWLTLFNRAQLKSFKGDDHQALVDLNQSIAKNDKYHFSVAFRGRLRLLQLDLEGAISDFRRAITINHMDSETLVYLGIAKCLKGDLKQALQDLNRAIQSVSHSQFSHLIYPYLTIAKCWRGEVHRRLGLLDESKADLRNASVSKKPTAASLLFRGEVYLAQGLEMEAKADFEAALSLLDEKSLLDLFFKGRINQLLGYKEQAITVYQQLLEKVKPPFQYVVEEMLTSLSNPA